MRASILPPRVASRDHEVALLQPHRGRCPRLILLVFRHHLAKLLDMAAACEPLCHFGGRYVKHELRCSERRWLIWNYFPTRLYFTSFPHPAPRPDLLNQREADNKPRIRGQGYTSTPVTPDDDAKYYYFTIDDQLVYLSFFQDWGPLNLAMVYKACILIHELLQVRPFLSFDRGRGLSSV